MPSYAWLFIRRDRLGVSADIGTEVYWKGEYRSSLPQLYEYAAAFGDELARGSWNAWATIARCHIALGEFEHARKALASARRLSNRVPAAIGNAIVHAAIDDFRAARDQGWGGVANGTRTPMLPWDRAVAAAVFARIHARLGRTERALSFLAQTVGAIESAGFADAYMMIADRVAETLWLTQQTAHVAMIERNINSKVVEPNYRHPMTDGRLALARLCALQQRYDTALEWFSRARTVLDEQGARPLRAIVDYDEALMYARRAAPDDRERGVPLLEAALQQFRAIQMPGWIRRAEHLLATGTEWSATSGEAQVPERPQGPRLHSEGQRAPALRLSIGWRVLDHHV